MPRYARDVGMARTIAPRPAVSTTGRNQSGLANTAHPGIAGARLDGSGEPFQLLSENPSVMAPGPVPASASCTANASPSHGRAPSSGCTVGATPAPAQPAP